MFESLVKYIRSGGIKDKVEIMFIDVISYKMLNYPAVLDLLAKGYKLPIVMINGAAKFHGGIPYEKVYTEIEKSI